MHPEEWQKALRKQFIEKNSFDINNLGNHPVYSDFSVYNPDTTNTYKVAIRSNPRQIETGINDNFCSCYDFKTNRLGTCKHIEAVMRKLYRNTHLRKYFKSDYKSAYSSVYLKYDDERTVKLKIGSENQEAFTRIAYPFFDENLTLKPTAFFSFEKFLAKAKAISPDFRCYDDALEHIIETREKNKRHVLLRDRIGGPKSNYFVSLIKTDLFPYQREGIYFAAKAGRCLIADEMGLGKTIQAIATAELLKKEFNISSVLIICPTSLKYQWQTEIEKFTDSTVIVIEGGPLKRAPQYKEAGIFYKIIGYHTAGNDLKYINESEPDLVILDEAQRIKNWKTRISRNIKKVVSPYAIVLTGTPLENKLEELYSIIQFIDPFLLGSLFNFLENYQVKDENGKVVGYQNLNKIGKTLSEVMLRRTRKQVLRQLPGRQDKNLFVPMTERQQEVHEEYADTVARLVHKWRRLGFLPEKDRQRLMICLNMMRMSCNSTYIIDQQTRNDTKIDELMSILEEIFTMQGQKVVIFSQWERMTRLVAQELAAKEIQFQYLHGGVPSAKRKELFVHFNNNPESKVFLSTDAGGVGLNLQAASYMVNLDIPWNPAVLEQRIARIYRMGQRRKVSIVNLVSSGTIEHRMLDVLKFKSSMAEGVLDQGEDAIFMSDSRFNEFMKSVENVVQTPSGQEKDPSFSIISEEEQDETSPIYTSVPDTNGKPHPEEHFAGDDDIKDQETEPASTQTVDRETPELISTGLNFFNQLAETLRDKEATEKLVASITEKDKNTGQTYLKIPVDDEKVIENALNVIGTLFKVFQNKDT